LILAAGVESVAGDFEVARQEVAVLRDHFSGPAHARGMQRRKETRKPTPAPRPALKLRRRKFEAECEHEMFLSNVVIKSSQVTGDSALQCNRSQASADRVTLHSLVVKTA
jgi:hypothetical protein